MPQRTHALAIGAVILFAALAAPPTGITAPNAPHGLDYVSDSALPPLTGQASAPITLPVPQKGVPASGVSYTITGQDKDTWLHVPNKTVTQFTDERLACYKSMEQYPTSGARLRGTQDGVATWDVRTVPMETASSASANGKARYAPNELYINTYVVCNTAGRNDARQDDAPLWFSQTINSPGHRVDAATAEAFASAPAASPAEKAALPTKAQVANYSETTGTIPDFIRKRIAPSEALRGDLEKRLTNDQKAALRAGQYVAIGVGDLPPDLQERALRYIFLARSIGYANPPAPTQEAIRPPHWEAFQVRFLPESAGINYRVLGVVTVDEYGGRVYF